MDEWVDGWVSRLMERRGWTVDRLPFGTVAIWYCDTGFVLQRMGGNEGQLDDGPTRTGQRTDGRVGGHQCVGRGWAVGVGWLGWVIWRSRHLDGNHHGIRSDRVIIGRAGPRIMDHGSF